jgi:hypothetical protein
MVSSSLRVGRYGAGEGAGGSIQERKRGGSRTSAIRQHVRELHGQRDDDEYTAHGERTGAYAR